LEKESMNKIQERITTQQEKNQTEMANLIKKNYTLISGTYENQYIDKFY